MATEQSGVTIDLGTLNPKQKLFTQAKSLFIAYGGARGGGKTHVSRIKALGGALKHPGIRVLFVRRQYPELEQSVIMPLRSMIPDEIARYNGTNHQFEFKNGSLIKCGHYGARDDDEYQGQEWDWVFVDEATQFTEHQFLILSACVRGTSKIHRHMFLTCNPGGIGHIWVKRLFIQRQFKPTENPEDYTFIPATIDDNPQLLEGSPQYRQMLDNLPPDVRRAWRFGDWDALAGTFFPEFKEDTHVIPNFKRIPSEYQLYRSIDYGLDMLACLWIAVDFNGRAMVYREVQQPNLIVAEAADLILSLTPPTEHVSATFAPPDLWNRQKDTGRTMAELFAENGLALLKASNNRVQGWALLKDRFKPMRDANDDPGMVVCEECKGLIANIQNIQHDPKNPSDCAVEPHDITHICDAARYFAVSRVMRPEIVEKDGFDDYRDEETAYDDYMTGSEADDDYINY